ncbi:LuxR C-terminal-related transcriptional regulator [Streptomyces sp. NPDC059171]|uniref:LuxR C-terminal-related transcriptional regulator n=1 Tax=Streptomyces sp. NPDC059171 TaxID=3346755 RepID=UPI00367FADD5
MVRPGGPPGRSGRRRGPGARPPVRGGGDAPVPAHGGPGERDAARQDLTVVGEASSGPRAEALCAELLPDIVLMDLRMPGGGVASIRRIRAAALPCRVVVLTTYESDSDILRAVEAGASGYLLKDLGRAELADAIRAAARGETVLAPTVATRLVDQLREAPEVPRLSERETQVLRLVAEGCTNAEIGRRLFIGESTVKTHLLRVFGKLGVSDRTAAVTGAMRHGLL